MRKLNKGGAGIPVVAFALIVLGGVGLAQEQPQPEPEPAPLEGATVDDAGWWNRARPEVELPTGQPPPPPTPGVPAGSLVVGANVGEPDAITAVAIRSEQLPGATIETYELTLREVDDEGANLNSTFAAITACPVTGFWLGGENGVWETRPTFDCETASAAGTRGEDGTWTFDLRQMGQLWSDGTLQELGVALVESVEPPTAFRTVFAGLGDLAIGVRVTASGGEEPADPFGSGSSGSGFDTGSTGGSGGLGSGSSGGFRPPPTPPAAPTTVPPAVEPGTGEEAAEAPLPTIPIGGGPGSPLGTLPWGTVPLVLLVAGFALLAMVALGPSGDPVLAGGGGRGVTRAIEARTKLDTDMEDA